MGSHINAEGQFQSDKYPTCPPGKVPLSIEDETAQDLLWIYAQRRRPVDAGFSDDLEAALRAAGYEPTPAAWRAGYQQGQASALDRARKLTTDQLKAAWDRYDGIDQPGDPSGEHIHLVLNERGEGAYCAV